MKRRVLSMLLVLTMVFSMAPLAVLAEEYPSITFGEAFLVEIEEGSSVWYKFVPEKTKNYVYSSYDNSDVDPVCKVYDSEMNLISESDDGDGSNFKNTVELTAGETYYFEFFEYYRNATGSYMAKVSRELPTDFNIDNYMDYAPHVGAEITLDFFVYPEDTDAVITWSSSDNEVATVDQNGNVKLVGVGDAVITGSVEGGLSDTFDITSRPSESIAIGDEKTVIFDGTLTKRDTVAAFRFVPEESAYYRMYSYDIVTVDEEHEVDPRLWIRDDYYKEIGYNDDGGEDVNVDGQAWLEKGKGYFFLIEPYDFESEGSIKVRFEKCVPIESIKIDCGDKTIKEGDYIDFYTTCEPANCGIEPLTFTSSNPSVVSIEGTTGYAVGAGEATITVRTEKSGLESSVTITVIGIEEVAVDSVFSIDCIPENYGGYEKFKFIPAESGIYRFESVKISGGWDPEIVLGDWDEQFRYGEDIGDDLNCCLEYALVAGETYYIEAYGEGDSTETGSVDFKVTKVNSEIPTLEINSSVETVIDIAGNGKYYVFKPAFSGMYSIFSTPIGEALDTKLFVYDKNWEIFYTNDDGGGDSQFNLEEEFTAGETYYIKSFLYDNDDTGSFNTNLEYLDGDVVRVSFDKNGGAGTMDNAALLSGSEYTLPENGFTAPAGMKFKAWSVNGEEKAAGDVIVVDADITVVAVWEEYTVDINGDGSLNMFDYMMLKSICLNKVTPSEEQYARADVNGDGRVNMFDYMAVKTMVLAQ